MTGRIARRFLRRAASPREEALRARQLMMFCGWRWWGLSTRQIAIGVGLQRQTIEEQLGHIARELLEVTDELELSSSAVFGDQVAFSDGEGI